MLSVRGDTLPGEGLLALTAPFLHVPSRKCASSTLFVLRRLGPQYDVGCRCGAGAGRRQEAATAGMRMGKGKGIGRGRWRRSRAC